MVRDDNQSEEKERNIIWGKSTQIQILFEEILHKPKYYLRRFYTNPNINWGDSTKKTNIIWGKFTQIQIWEKSTQILTLFDEILHKSKHYLTRFSTNPNIIWGDSPQIKHYLTRFSTNPNIIWWDSPQIQTLFDEILHKSNIIWGDSHLFPAVADDILCGQHN